MRDETGRMIKQKENLFHRVFIELLLEHVTVNEIGFNILYIPFLLISNQFISQQSSMLNC